MKCSICGKYIERGDRCADCLRDEVNRERAQLQIAANENFYRKLFQDQIANQRKIAEEQAKDLDFRDVRRRLLDLDLQAHDDPVSAQKKSETFFANAIFREHSGKLLDTIVGSEFLLECFCSRELQSICACDQDPKEIDWTLDFYSESCSQPFRKVYSKLVAMVTAGHPSAAGLRPDIAEIIRTHAARRRAKQEQEEEEERHKWEEFLQAYEEMRRLALLPVLQNAPSSNWFHALGDWFARTFPITCDQRVASRRFHEERRQREVTIKDIIEWIDQGREDFLTELGQEYSTIEMCVMAQLWFRSHHDRQLIVRVTAQLLRQQGRDIKSAVAAAIDEFQDLSNRK